MIEWWGWWDSNLLSGKAPDLQSGPALQLRGTPLDTLSRKQPSIFRIVLYMPTFVTEPLEGLEPPTS